MSAFWTICACSDSETPPSDDGSVPRSYTCQVCSPETVRMRSTASLDVSASLPLYTNSSVRPVFPISRSWKKILSSESIPDAVVPLNWSLSPTRTDPLTVSFAGVESVPIPTFESAPDMKRAVVRVFETEKTLFVIRKLTSADDRWSLPNDQPV